MTKKEVVIIISVILVIAGINAVNYARREKLKRDITVYIEEKKIQIGVNSADAEQLEELPGIGPVIARRIVTYREVHGQFGEIDDLMRVKGINKRVFEKIVPYIRL